MQNWKGIERQTLQRYDLSAQNYNKRAFNQYLFAVLIQEPTSAANYIKRKEKSSSNIYENAHPLALHHWNFTSVILNIFMLFTAASKCSLKTAD